MRTEPYKLGDQVDHWRAVRYLIHKDQYYNFVFYVPAGDNRVVVSYANEVMAKNNELLLEHILDAGEHS